MVPKKESSKGNKQVNKEEKLKKPFGFCCDENSQDSRTRYDQRKPPFTSSLTDVVLSGGGPDLKFRVQDIINKTVTRSGTPKSYLKLTSAYLGGCRWCRGPINCYLEDEISVAQEMFVKLKRERHKAECQRDIISARKKIMRRRKRKRDIRESKKPQTQDEIETNSEIAKNGNGKIMQVNIKN